MKAPAKYDVARRALSEAKRLDEVKSIRDKAVALQVYAKQAKDRSLIEDATEIRLRAERRAGELLRELKERKERHSGRNTQNLRGSRSATPVEPKLSDLGVTKTQSSRWQRLANLDPDYFESRVQTAKKRATSALDGIHRELKQQEARAVYEATIKEGSTVDDLHALAASGYRAAVIYSDVPLGYETYSGKYKQRSAERYYDTMDVAALKAMAPTIQVLAAKDSALLFWGTWPQLDAVLDIIAAWGFDFSSAAFVWVKTNGETARTPEDLKPRDLHWGNGFRTRANTEFVLLATRGAPMRLANDVHQVVIAPAMAHSAKPDEVRHRIERLFPGPYLELFGRKPVEGWTVWGNEIPRDRFRRAGP
jgi:N6-adenosine-specific RNA methylase IME4